jgi:fatty-acyl-CoA synthase
VLSRHPDVVTAAVYATPDPRTGDEVMAALELQPDAGFDPAEFADFLGAQADLGTKWAPRFIRVIAAMPLTATNKVDKTPLRQAGWEVADHVFIRPAADLRYVEFTAADRAHYRAEFARHSRHHLLPPSRQR